MISVKQLLPVVENISFAVLISAVCIQVTNQTYIHIGQPQNKLITNL